MKNYPYKAISKSKILFTIILQLVLTSALQGQITFDPQPSFFRNQREMPLIDLTTKQDINVSAYGAIINDGIDDLAAIQAAINAAKAVATASNPVRVVFQNGVYDIKPVTVGPGHSLFVTFVSNVVFEGNGAEIRNHNPTLGVFETRSCTNVIFKNFVFDYAVLPFTQGVVTSKNESNNTFTVYIDPKFPSLLESHFITASERWGCLKDATGKLKAGANNLFPYLGWTTTAFANTFRINSPSISYTRQVAVGDYFVQIARINGTAIFNTVACKNVTYLNVNIYSSPAGSFGGRENYEFNIINCNVIPKPGSGRVHTGNADIIHVTGSYIGPWVQGCRFEGQTDDVVNLKHTTRLILEVVSPTVLKVKFKVATSDKLVIFNPRTGLTIATPKTITKVVNLGNNIFEVTFDTNHNVTVVGEHQTADKAYMTNSSCESFIFRNNIFKNGRRYGLLLQSSYGQVKECTFENLSSSGIKMENGVDWSEGYVANNIEITNNSFINCGFDSSYVEDPDAAAISTVVSKLKSPCNDTYTWCGTEPVVSEGLKNITITNNNFIYNKTGINIKNIDGGTITGNTFVHNTPDITLNPGVSFNNILSSNSSNLIFDTLSNLSFEESNLILSRNGNLLLIVDKSNESSACNIALFDSIGRRLQSKTLNGQSTFFDISGYQKGLYIVTVENDKSKTFKKIIL